MRTKCLLFYIALVGAVSCPEVFAEPDVAWDFSADQALLEEARDWLESSELPTGRKVVQLKYERHIDISAEQVFESVRQIFYYPAPDSVQNSGSDSISWNTHNESLTVTAAAVISSNGTVHRLKPETARILSQSSASVFTTSNEVVLQLPGLDVGSVSVLGYTRKVEDPDNFLFNSYAHVGTRSLQRDFIVTWDDRAPLWHADSEAFECETSTSRVICRSRLIEPMQRDEQVFYADVLPRFSVAADNTWDDVIHAMRGLIDSAMHERVVLEPLINDLEALDDPFPQLLELVAKDVRYVSFSAAEHAYLPHSISHTLNNRYGDCKDKSTLLLALLEELGYEAYPVLVATYMQNPAAAVIPSRGYFDHMVVCVQLPGRERCLDPTDMHASSQVTPRAVQGKVRLNLLPGSTPDKIPTDDYVWRYEFKNELKFRADGSQSEALERTYLGAYAAWMRGELGARDEDEQSNWLLEQLTGVVNGTQAPQFEVQRLDDVEAPLIVHHTGRYTDIAPSAEALTYTDGAFWIRNDLKQERIENEHYAVDRQGVHYRSIYHYDLNGLWQLQDTGANVQFDASYGSFMRTYEESASGVIVRTELRIPSQRIEPTQFETFNRFVDLVLEEIEIRFWGKPSTQ